MSKRRIPRVLTREEVAPLLRLLDGQSSGCADSLALTGTDSNTDLQLGFHFHKTRSCPLLTLRAQPATAAAALFIAARGHIH